MAFASGTSPSSADEAPAEAVAVPERHDAVAVDAPVADAPVAAEQLIEPALLIEAKPVDERRWPRRVWDALGTIGEWLFGVTAIIGGLAVLAPLPILQFLSLGYLLEAGGRVARTGRFRQGFVGVRKAARVGSIAIGCWLLLWPLRFVSTMAASAELVAPGGAAARNWSTAYVVLTVLIGLHIVGALWRGGRLRSFLWPRPIKTLRSMFARNALRDARDAVWDFVQSLRLPYYFWLGLRGYAGGLLWLFVPTTLLALGSTAPPAAVLGGVLLMPVLMYLPLLQTRFACENRFRAFFEWRSVRQVFRRGPVAVLFAILVTLAFALPLYLLKIETIPREVAWLPSVVFVIFIWPARVLTGWAYGYAVRREKPRHFVFRWLARLALVAVAAIYVFIVFFSQFTSWAGVASLYEQHAFLLPAPFLSF